MIERLGVVRASEPLAARGRRRPKPRCPCCGAPGGFCEPHKALLARIRVEFEAENQKRRKDTKYSIRGANNGIVGRRRSWKTDWDLDLEEDAA